MDDFKHEDELKKAYKDRHKAKSDLAKWSDIVGFFGLILGTIIGSEISKTLGGIVCLISFVIWIMMKDASEKN